MSRLKERPEKNCLNCNTEVQGRFCHVCGQENIEIKESVWDLVSHFFRDITHFDGKFFSSLKYLVFRPGFLSKEYMIGRRASYVNPIRMYIFTSAFFFLIFFSLFKVDKNTTLISGVTMNNKTYEMITAMDSLEFDAFTRDIKKEDSLVILPMSREAFKKYFDSTVQKRLIHFSNADFRSKPAYDSALKAGRKEDGWLKRQLIYKEIELNEKYGTNTGQAFKDFAGILLHSLPQMFFILLPLFAMILKLLYFRSKNYYYVNHGIFSLHFYIFSFITMLVLFGLNKINFRLEWKFISVLQVIIGAGIFIYLYKAMRRFYQQRRAKTIFKFLMLCFLLLLTILLLFVLFVLFSLYKL
ncbi:MAG: DUF3667 domain-containing protein [Chitinophagaceae bacterium]|nr:DUF3667 domain-containing protein [Chitinophagaceae bacterium]